MQLEISLLILIVEDIWTVCLFVCLDVNISGLCGFPGSSYDLWVTHVNDTST